ncbi:YdiY family protein [Verrucomicrobiota bacterium]
MLNIIKHFLSLLALTLVYCIATGLTTNASAEEPEGWDAGLALGVSTTSGNSETLSANASLTGTKITDKHELRLGAEGSYAESELEVVSDGTTNTIDETTAQNAKAYVNYKRKFGALYGYSDNSIFHDDPAAIDYRLMTGLGGGGYIIQTDSTKLGIETGATYINEELTTGEDDDYIAVRFAARHDQALSETSKIWESLEYLPRADDWDDYLFNAEAGIEAAVNTTVSLRVVIQNRYDSEPPADIDNNDLSIIGSFVYKL